MAYMAGNSWEGNLNNFGKFKDAEIEDATFHPQGEVQMTITFDSSGDEEEVDFEGIYKIDSNYNFEAILYGNDDMVDQDLFPDIDRIDYRLEMEGYLNGYSREGYGEYTLKCTAYYHDNTIIKDRIDGDWELWK